MRNKTLISNNKFNIGFRVFGSIVKIDLHMKTSIGTTKSISSCTDCLLAHVPSVFTTQCFNDKNLSFYDEVKDTQLGHLFEHILIEYMCLYKLKFQNSVNFSGRTYWRSQYEDPRDFTVIVNCKIIDWPIFIKALKKTILVFQNLIEERHLSASPQLL